MSATAPPSPGSAWPPLPLAGWRDTQATLHMWTQVVGKTRLALAPMENHWWQCTLYVSERGLTTTPMPDGVRLLTVDFDFVDQLLVLRTAEGESRQLPLAARSVARFHAQYLRALRELALRAADACPPRRGGEGDPVCRRRGARGLRP